jgi:hypothetical protein
MGKSKRPAEARGIAAYKKTMESKSNGLIKT